jgi:S-formylglutathione hydrolase FrmB
MISNFGVSTDRANWGIVGWSMGGTCAIDLTVMHPETFSAFVDIGGDLGPNVGTKAQTIAGLFGGNADAWAGFDPTTVITGHNRYTGVSGWFAFSTTAPESQDVAAKSLCALGSERGIECAVAAQRGKHDWPFAAQAFAAALPWLAGRLGTSGVPQVLLPGPAPVPSLRPAPHRRHRPPENDPSPSGHADGAAALQPGMWRRPGC